MQTCFFGNRRCGPLVGQQFVTRTPTRFHGLTFTRNLTRRTKYRHLCKIRLWPWVLYRRKVCDIDYFTLTNFHMTLLFTSVEAKLIVAETQSTKKTLVSFSFKLDLSVDLLKIIKYTFNWTKQASQPATIRYYDASAINKFMHWARQRNWLPAHFVAIPAFCAVVRYPLVCTTLNTTQICLNCFTSFTLKCL